MDGWQIDSGTTAAQRSNKDSLPLRVGEWLVFLVLLTSFYVKSEPGQEQPTPYDILMVMTIGLLFMFGLRLPRGLGFPAAFWGLIVVGFSIGAMESVFPEKVRPALMIVIYLIGSFFFFTSFVFANPMRRLEQLFWAYTIAACIAAFLAVGAYLGFIPGGERFLVYGRATGTFNDPNVFGPFLVAPILFLGWKLSQAKFQHMLLLAAPFSLLILALLLSFSRGAWGNFLLSAIVFFVLTLATSRSTRQTFRLIGFAAFASLVMLLVIGVALSTPAVADLFSERASLTQHYDTDPEHGRFESQSRALRMALDNPMGIGPAQWAMINNLDTHNVYLHVLVAGGFLSGLAFIGFLILTLVRAWSAIGRAGSYRGILIVLFAVLVGHVAEAVIIDILNWRHFHLLLGMIWGTILAVEKQGGNRLPVFRSRLYPGIAQGRGMNEGWKAPIPGPSGRIWRA